MSNIQSQLEPLTQDNLERGLFVRNMRFIFADINKSYPWIIAEIFVDLQNESKVNQSFIDEALSPLFCDTEKEKLMQLATECLPVEETRQRLAVDFFSGDITPEKMQSALNRDPMSLDREQNPGCLPFDDGANSIFATGVLGAVASKKFADATGARKLVSHMKTLEGYYALLKTQEDTFKEEIPTLATVLDNLAR